MGLEFRAPALPHRPSVGTRLGQGDGLSEYGRQMD